MASFLTEFFLNLLYLFVREAISILEERLLAVKVCELRRMNKSKKVIYAAK